MPFHDANSLDKTQLSADLCIIGAGAAGICIASELAGTGLRIALVESGDVRHRHLTQFLYIGRQSGQRSFSTVVSRFRRLGGSTTHWGGQCRPLDPIDFQQRDAIAYSGWPFQFEDLEPYYQRASRLCQIGDFEAFKTSAATVSGTAHGPIPDFPYQRLETPRYRFAYPRDFSVAHAQVLSETSNIDVYLNANLIEIEQSPGGERVTGLSLATLNRRRIRIRAENYVLACGGIENARLLLVNRRVMSNGIGNEHDLLGRYFMDHPYFFPGLFEPEPGRLDPELFTIRDYDRVGKEQVEHLGISLNEATRRDDGLNAAAMYLVRREDYKTRPEYTAPGGKALNQLIDVLRHRELPLPEVLHDIAALRTGYRDASTTLCRQVRSIGRKRFVHAVRIVLEQTPHPASRVTLTRRLDRFGTPRVNVHWHVPTTDLRAFHRLVDEVGQNLADQRLGRLITHQGVSDSAWLRAMTGGKHHIGTTRMHEDPRQGVVDAQCRIHGMSNLYVSGSSVFPTQGYANPTLTIVALAVRLSDHLRAQFGSSVNA